MPSTNPVDNLRLRQPTMREGIPVDKGVVLSEEFCVQNEKLFQQYADYFMRYPDLFLDTVKSTDCPINLYYYQRIILRAMMRYTKFFGTFTRATSKSFLAIISEYLTCVFLPRSKRFVVSQFKKASLDITKQKLEELWTFYPILKQELAEQHMSTDYIELVFKNGSTFQILSLAASQRGTRATGGIIEEAALVDGTMLGEVILPMMNVKRRLPNGDLDDDEPHAQQKYITSAGTKTCFAYQRLIDLLVDQTIDPTDTFVCGAGYELPVHYGLLNKKFLREQKMSTSFSEESFARESQSIWTGVSEDAWFNVDKLLRARKLLNAERQYCSCNNKDAYYEIACDIARYGGNDTSLIVIKVFPRDGVWLKSVVYIENISKMAMHEQALRIKELIRLYKPYEVVIDGNGVGAGIIDEMVVPSMNARGQMYPAYFVKNDPENYPTPRDQKANEIIYNIKANPQMNSDIYSNLYVQINNGYVNLLANERVAKQKLMSTKKGQQMTYLEREKFLLPYIMTSRLIDEINNLQMQPTGAANQVAVKQISKKINKDRVSALGYGLYRIKDREDNEVRKRKKGLGNVKELSFFTSKRR